MRFTIHERKNKSKGEATASTYDFLNRALKALTQKYYLASLQVFEMADDWHHQTESCGQSPAEMPGNTSEYGPSELYSGNHTSKP